MLVVSDGLIPANPGGHLNTVTQLSCSNYTMTGGVPLGSSAKKTSSHIITAAAVRMDPCFHAVYTKF